MSTYKKELLMRVDRLHDILIYEKHEIQILADLIAERESLDTKNFFWVSNGKNCAKYIDNLRDDLARVVMHLNEIYANDFEPAND